MGVSRTGKQESIKITIYSFEKHYFQKKKKFLKQGKYLDIFIVPKILVLLY